MTQYSEIEMLIRMLGLLVTVTEAKTASYTANVGEIVKVDPS